ncbi:unnamed protein product [Rotaria sp. Silwood1]|nr:unnamed protein product [Rotaria sp. Silwood1]CAF4958222.1 unnamed protein product [Rotaria sp. Silwood1]
MEHYHCNDKDKLIKRILSLASDYKCPMHIKSNDNLQYFDFYHSDNVLKCDNVKSDVKIYELDDSTQTDCRMRKFEWGYVLCESFEFRNSEIYEPFYADVWSRVEIGPTKPASGMDAPVYKKLGFKFIPSYKTFVKIATIARKRKSLQELKISPPFGLPY